MGKLRNFLFPTKENSVFETTTIVDKDQVNTPKTSSATLITNPEKEIEKKSGMEENSLNAKKYFMEDKTNEVYKNFSKCLRCCNRSFFTCSKCFRRFYHIQ